MYRPRHCAWFVPLALSAAAVLFAAPARGGDPTLHGWWRFDERSGLSAADSSNYQNSGLLYNVQPLPAVLDFGIRFLGTESRVSVPHHPTLNATDAVTVSAWVNGNLSTAMYGYKLIARKGNSYFLAISGNRAYCRISDGAWRVAAGPTFLENDQWHHLAMTYDRALDGNLADLATFNGFRPHPANPMVARGAVDEWDRNLREIGNVLFEPDQPDPARRYRLFYTGYPGTIYQQNITHIGMACSPDGVQWTKFGNIIPQRALEDPFVVKHDGVYYLFAEDKADVPFRNIRRFHSLDGENWTDDGDVLDVQPDGQPAWWEGRDVSSPAVLIENGVWYMFYEGRGTTAGAIGLATSLDGLTWTRPSLDPLVLPSPDGTWDDFSIVPDDILKLGDTFYLLYHGAGTASRNLYCTGMMTSTDLIHWTRYPHNPFLWADGAMFFADPDGVGFLAMGGESNIGRYAPIRVCGPRLFVNGVEEPFYINRNDTANRAIIPDGLPFSIGNYYVGGPNWFDGVIDDVRLYTRALTPEEILALCEAERGAPRGDVNCDGAIDFLDIDPFLLALFEPNAYGPAYPGCTIQTADLNADGMIDFFDVDPFIAALFGP